MMPALIWVLIFVLQTSTVSVELPEPVNVTLSSRHLVHILTWQSGPGAPAHIYYNVTVYSSTTPSWVPVEGCEHVVWPLVCNLTEALPQHATNYYIGVFGVLGPRHSAPASPRLFEDGFSPLKDTHLDPPLVSVGPCGGSLCVDLRPPLESLRSAYDSFEYTLNFSSGKNRGQFSVKTKTLKKVVLKDVVTGVQYCVTVAISNRKSASSQARCGSTTAANSPDLLIGVILCFSVVSLGVVVVVLYYTGFFCLMVSPPAVLSSVRKTPEHPLQPHEKLQVSKVQVSPGEQSDEDEGEADRKAEAGGYKARPTRSIAVCPHSSVLLRPPPQTQPQPQRELSPVGPPTHFHSPPSGPEANRPPRSHNASGRPPPTMPKVGPPSFCRPNVEALHAPEGDLVPEEEEYGFPRLTVASVTLGVLEELGEGQGTNARAGEDLLPGGSPDSSASFLSTEANRADGEKDSSRASSASDEEEEGEGGFEGYMRR